MSANTININNLLQNVAVIQMKYDEKAEKAGDNFNVFSIMKMEHSEVNTHSAIIGELLNPNGSHGQEDTFLNLFVEIINDSFKDYIKINEFNNLVNDIICERTISLEINWENVTGGRIDLIVEDHKQILIIENKLYAIDQPLQLIRYDNYAKTKGKDYYILYLTLFGKELEKEEMLYGKIRGYNFNHKEISEFNIFKEEKSNNHCCWYYPISFKDHIKNWIVKCIEIIDIQSKPLLKATLEQYLNLINKITFQTMSDNMKTDIVNKILKDSENKSENVKSAFAIAESIESLKYKIYENLIDKLKKCEIFDKVEKMNDTEYGGISFNPIRLKREIGLYLWKGKNYFDTSFVGFRIDSNFSEIIKNKYRKNTTFKIEDNWIYKYPTNSWTDNSETWIDLSKPIFKTEKEEASIRYTEIINIINEFISIENPI